MPARKTWLSADEACALLGVKTATLYTYVSRGWLRRVPSGKGKRNVYHAEDVAKLCERRDARAGHTVAAAGALHFGQPVLESDISSTRDGHIAYRGVSLQQILDEQWSFERVTGWLWTQQQKPVAVVHAGSVNMGHAPPAALPPAALPPTALPPTALPPVAAPPFVVPTATEAARELLRLAPADAQAVGPEAELSAGVQAIAVVAAMGVSERALSAASADEQLPLRAGEGRPSADRPHLAAWICDRFGERRPTAIAAVNAALVVCADHDLAASTFTARVTASTGASLEHCVAAALCSFSGARHGGVCDRLAYLLGTIETQDEARSWVASRRRAGDSVPGFAHQLYPEGDPRTIPLMRFAHQHGREDAPWRAVEAEMQRLGFRSPRIDFGLVALCSALGWPPRAAGWLFAIGRTAGWVAHVIEQRHSVDVLRPRSASRGGERA